eukprot:480988-Hanusia_phi.AAC.1
MLPYPGHPTDPGDPLPGIGSCPPALWGCQPWQCALPRARPVQLSGRQAAKVFPKSKRLQIKGTRRQVIPGDRASLSPGRAPAHCPTAVGGSPIRRTPQTVTCSHGGRCICKQTQVSLRACHRYWHCEEKREVEVSGGMIRACSISSTVIS